VESSGGSESTLANWRSALEDANEEFSLGVAKLAVGAMSSDDSLEEVAKLAVGAMSSTDSLDEVDEELVKRRKSLRGSESGGSESAG
jgi:hypothetical protein